MGQVKIPLAEDEAHLTSGEPVVRWTWSESRRDDGKGEAEGRGRGGGRRKSVEKWDGGGRKESFNFQTRGLSRVSFSDVVTPVTRTDGEQVHKNGSRIVTCRAHHNLGISPPSIRTRRAFQTMSTHLRPPFDAT